MSDEETAARQRCIASGKAPDAMWPGRHLTPDGTLAHDTTVDGQPRSYAWRAFTDPPQFRGSTPMPAPDPFLQTLGRMETSIANVDQTTALTSIAISLRRIADALETRTTVSLDIDLNETLQSAVGALGNTLAEHRMYSR